jgi:hypothetical protein
MREVISRARERPLDLPDGLSVDILVYDEMQKGWALWVVRAFGKRRGKELEDLMRKGI